MWQVLILREHTNAATVRTSCIWFNISLEGIEVALMTNHIKRIYVMYLTVTTITYVRQYNKLQAYSIVQTLLVDNVTQLVCNTCLSSIVEDRILLGNNLD